MSLRFCTCDSIEAFARLAMMVTAAFLVWSAAFGAGARAETDVHRQDGVTLRLIALPPDAQGVVRGALSIELDPGWKTYWVAPGPVGLAPRLNFAGSADVAAPIVAFPVPVRFMEGAAESIGYDEPVAFAIEATAAGALPVLRVDALLGVCRELCVPVQASLAAEPSRSLSDRALVSRAEAGLPVTEGPLRISAARWSKDGGALLIDLAGPAKSEAVEVFASVGEGWSFGRPVARGQTGDAKFMLPVLARPKGASPPSSVDLLLTAGERAQLSRAVPIAPR